MGEGEDRIMWWDMLGDGEFEWICEYRRQWSADMGGEEDMLPLTSGLGSGECEEIVGVDREVEGCPNRLGEAPVSISKSNEVAQSSNSRKRKRQMSDSTISGNKRFRSMRAEGHMEYKEISSYCVNSEEEYNGGCETLCGNKKSNQQTWVVIKKLNMQCPLEVCHSGYFSNGVGNPGTDQTKLSNIQHKLYSAK